jgi:pyruvate/2-oxoglutarate dehydrogenase complex dihydrolipoamide acyltransferase (E2) component
MAAEHGLDLSRIPGTGIDGRVTRKDVEAYLASGAPAAPAAPPRAPAPPAFAEAGPPPKAPAPPAAVPAPAVSEGDQMVPWTPIRKRIAKHMSASKQISPHVHVFAEVDMHKAANHREVLKSQGGLGDLPAFRDVRGGPALKEFPP